MRIREKIKKIIGVEFEWDSHYENIIKLINANLIGRGFFNFLDVGCGDGARGAKIARYLKVNENLICGIERELDLLRNSHREANKALADLEQGFIPFQENTFGIVICNQVLEHVKNYKEVICEIIRVTDINGYIILGIPNLAHLMNRLLLLCGRQPMCIGLDSSHVRGFTHSAFLSMLHGIEGVKVVDTMGSSLMYPLPICLAEKLSNRFIGMTAYTCYLIQKFDFQ